MASIDTGLDRAHAVASGAMAKTAELTAQLRLHTVTAQAAVHELACALDDGSSEVDLRRAAQWAVRELERVLLGAA
jgi:hypothetical protein